MECEEGGNIYFLSCSVYRRENTFGTSVLRKHTFSGLGTSFCTFKFKLNSIKTLLYRGYNISLNYFNILHA